MSTLALEGLPTTAPEPLRGEALPELPELLPCPFCGGVAEMVDVSWMLGARRALCCCIECRAQGQDVQYRPGPDHGLRDEAMYAATCAWNTRAPCRRRDDPEAEGRL